MVLQGVRETVSYLFGLRGTEKHGLPLLRQQLDNLVHLFLKSLLQDAIGFINDQHLHVAEEEAPGILHEIRSAGAWTKVTNDRPTTKVTTRQEVANVARL